MVVELGSTDVVVDDASELASVVAELMLVTAEVDVPELLEAVVPVALASPSGVQVSASSPSAC